MREIFSCIKCGDFSFEIICKNCQKKFLTSSFYEEDGIVSFYDYYAIEDFIKYKYHKFGSFVYKILAKNSFNVFAKKFELKRNFFAIPIDDKIEKGFSHTAILANALKPAFKPLFSTLHAKNEVKYAGKSLEFRLKNPRDFIYKGKQNISVVLVDDVVTTGMTINEAKEILSKNGVDVAFSLVLSNLKA
ncbi:ComF family protein [Caminibacter pacificus]|uniref:ComF family protein n=1 Tax=Caminibacter pacificus TaxID=1424653 RepID=A0AAJ4REL0_9BACT|nr:ComF family protein [Caminibacter pacificus]NPA87150.1 ComF family protein [Campylobacterota bacterium]QCI28069.1 ComF family protein [Caminibacter pacificus]ROR41223.1 competence protein ComFC [Caminibacter pacificus]